jgi:hypothetical protein
LARIKLGPGRRTSDRLSWTRIHFDVLGRPFTRHCCNLAHRTSNSILLERRCLHLTTTSRSNVMEIPTPREEWLLHSCIASSTAWLTTLRQVSQNNRLWLYSGTAEYQTAMNSIACRTKLSGHATNLWLWQRPSNWLTSIHAIFARQSTLVRSPKCHSVHRHLLCNSFYRVHLVLSRNWIHTYKTSCCVAGAHIRPSCIQANRRA